MKNLLVRSCIGSSTFNLAVEALRYKPEVGGFDPRWGHWNFLIDLSFRLRDDPGVDLASNRN